MKYFLNSALCALTVASFVSGSAAYAQDDRKRENIKPAPVVIRFQTHSMNANDFQVARSKHREIELQIKQKGMDVAFTEWMQRDHPYVFAHECVKQVGEISNEFKSTNHMLEFDKLIEKRGDLRIQADKYGHDVAFAEWLRTEHPDIYRAHFGVRADARMHGVDRHVKKDDDR